MIVVSDTTPIISLLKINRLDILEKLFSVVEIPQGVYTELVSNPSFSEESAIISDSSFLHRVTIQDYKSVELLRRATGLDLGESEAIIYSDVQKADFVLMDEVKGRTVAKQMGLTVMGTVGILLTAFEENIVSKDEILEFIDILRNEGRHISEKLYQELVAKIS